MPDWLSLVLALCALAVSAGIVLALLAVRRALDRTARVLAIVEGELPALTREARGLTEDARTLTQEATRELKRTGDVVDRVHAAVDGVARVTGALASLTRVGQLVGVAAGVRRGVDVFVRRMRKEGGSDHAA